MPRGLEWRWACLESTQMLHRIKRVKTGHHLWPFVGYFSWRIKLFLLSFVGCDSLSSGIKRTSVFKGAGLKFSLQEVACFYLWKLQLHNLLLFHLLFFLSFSTTKTGRHYLWILLIMLPGEDLSKAIKCVLDCPLAGSDHLRPCLTPTNHQGTGWTLTNYAAAVLTIGGQKCWTELWQKRQAAHFSLDVEKSKCLLLYFLMFLDRKCSHSQKGFHLLFHRLT